MAGNRGLLGWPAQRERRRDAGPLTIVKIAHTVSAYNPGSGKTEFPNGSQYRTRVVFDLSEFIRVRCIIGVNVGGGSGSFFGVDYSPLDPSVWDTELTGDVGTGSTPLTPTTFFPLGTAGRDVEVSLASAGTILGPWVDLDEGAKTTVVLRPYTRGMSSGADFGPTIELMFQ